MRNSEVSRFDPFKFAAVTIVILVALTIVSSGLHPWKNWMQGRDHTMARARTDLAIISSATRTLTTIAPAALSPRALDNLDSKSLYTLLSATNEYGARVLEPSEQWDSRKDLVDPWGRPIRVRATILATNGNGPISLAEAIVKLWSIGPNGTDENGSGDDIVGESFQIQFRNRETITK